MHRFAENPNAVAEAGLQGRPFVLALASRQPHPQLRVDPEMPDDTRLWAALQQVGGGTWGGCVYDLDEIVRRLKSSTPGSSSKVIDAAKTLWLREPIRPAISTTLRLAFEPR